MTELQRAILEYLKANAGYHPPQEIAMALGPLEEVLAQCNVMTFDPNIRVECECDMDSESRLVNPRFGIGYRRIGILVKK